MPCRFHLVKTTARVYFTWSDEPNYVSVHNRDQSASRVAETLSRQKAGSDHNARKAGQCAAADRGLRSIDRNYGFARKSQSLADFADCKNGQAEASDAGSGS